MPATGKHGGRFKDREAGPLVDKPGFKAWAPGSGRRLTSALLVEAALPRQLALVLERGRLSQADTNAPSPLNVMEAADCCCFQGASHFWPRAGRWGGSGLSTATGSSPRSARPSSCRNTFLEAERQDRPLRRC